ncbi:hypothetical protein GCM10008927_17250 [Amylibacter ulvae]|uniref:DUF2059 domain-containing protein n=1 Tax=Paramylibacter ulvae TaxID=1651968 RepID=A0ABQ3D283_9RHOB|nr:hypothetical protein [Amylibacter ulvae]GHA52380.1 hypothetical protein GCM10008927_17250 [Amylibacter ulvae]
MRYLISCVAIVFTIATSVQAYEDTRGGKLLTLMGFDVAIASLVPQMKAVKDNAPDMGDEVFDDWDVVVEQVYQPDAIMQATAEALTNALTATQSETLTTYFSSGIGYEMTQLENAANGVESIGMAETYGPGILQELSEVNPERLGQINDLIDALGIVENSTAGAMNMGFALTMGMISASDNPLGVTEQQVLRHMAAQHDEIANGMKLDILNGTAFTYQNASNEEFAEYVEFLKSDLAQKLYRTVRDVENEMINGFSRKLGRELVKRASARKL